MRTPVLCVFAAFCFTGGAIFGSLTTVTMNRNKATVLQEHDVTDLRPKRHTFTSLEAWGAGYAQGFGDSVAMCRQALHKQREKMLEQMEPLAPGWDSAETPSSGTDRHGVTLPGFGSPTLP